MSGRSCSLAWAVGGRRSAQRADAEALSAFHELHLKLFQRDAAGLFDKREDQALVRIDARRPTIAAALVGGRTAGLLPPLTQADRACRGDAETVPPPDTAATTRSRRSSERVFFDMPASLLRQQAV
jgi:hypothetical protein